MQTPRGVIRKKDHLDKADMIGFRRHDLIPLSNMVSLRRRLYPDDHRLCTTKKVLRLGLFRPILESILGEPDRFQPRLSARLHPSDHADLPSLI
jgi:hypothetical protein